MMGIFVQSFISDFGEAKLAFHDTENVFDFSADFRFVPIPGSLCIIEFDIAAAFFIGKVFS